MNQHLQNILNLIQQDEQLSAKEKESIIRSLEYANKELEITAFKLDRTDKVKRTTAILLEETIAELELKRKDVESQNRELEIESALERVRSATMSMRNSSELGNLIFHLYTELTKLDAKLDRCFIMIVNPETLGITWWLSGKEGLLGENGFLVQNNDYPSHQLYLKHWREKNANWQYLLEGKEKEEWDQFGFSKTDLVKLPDAVKKDMSGVKRTWLSGSSDSFGCLLTGSFEQLSEEHQNILSRFAKVFNQTYTRFLDLQKAEAQAREAQIEAALERVRSRTMGMQKSDELKDVIRLVYEQFILLKIHIEHTGFLIDYNTRDDLLHIWLADEHLAPSEVTFPWFDCPPNNSIRDAKNKGEDFFKYHLTFEEKNKFYQDLFQLIPGVPEETKAYYQNCPGLAGSGVLLESVGLYIENFSGTPYTEEENAVLMRFGKVFQQTYTRFLDLQKAEAQAREAQIEAALERVRSRTMAMQHSDELNETADLLFEQLKKLGADLQGVAFTICDKDSTIITKWTSIGIFSFPYTIEPAEQNMYEAWKNNVPLYEEVFEGERLRKYYETLMDVPEFKQGLQKILDAGFPIPTWQKNHAVSFQQGYLLVITTKPFEETQIFVRFGKVFEQTYTRFLDLQKAETQARESQIQLALERLRARTMAMHMSDELSQVAVLLFDQIKELGIDAWTCGYNIWREDKKAVTAWMSRGAMLPEYRYPLTENPTLKHFYEAAQRGDALFVEEVSGETLTELYRYLGKIHASEGILDTIRTSGYSPPTFQVNHAAYFKYGYLLLVTYKPYPEAHDIFKRFASVFEQTYTRFIDLQKAETQAREAQIEAALERVRSRAMSMHASTELKDVATEMRNQLHLLGQKALETCAIHLYDTTPDYVETWAALRLADSDDEMVRVEAAYPKKGVRLLEEAFANYSSGKNDYMLLADKEKEIEFFEEIKKRSPDAYTLVIESTKYKKEDEIWAYWSVSDFQGGSLVMVTGDEPHEEERKLLRRFANVFGLAYQRFVDLQKAESSAREAIKQAALDRIRADIASMRTTEDLERITPVIWTELKILGIPFIRCGVFIMDEEKELIHTFLSTPEGKAIAAIHIPYNTSGKIQLIPENWRADNPYTDLWQDADFVDFANILTQQKVIASPDEYLSGVPHGGFYLHFVPFVQGMMYVGNATELNEQEINLLQSVADAFATAYARYEDFNKLEAAKKQVDSTLSELQSTQKQLIQSEKMASLGELTAGIAHEIQNPLNFVNNFSEVSKELLDEMKEAMDKGDSEEAKEIMQDVINNLEKINHHGKRADGIVKGMLQHSRTSSGQKEMTDINALCDEYVRLSYHGLRAKDKTFNAKFETDFDASLPKINVVPQEMGRVILNLINNAFYAVSERKKPNEPGYEPTVIVSTRKEKEKIEIRVKDNGTGIPKSVVDKIFQPFFTTKPTGKGTGLGLSLAYDTVKAHGGELKVETKEGEGSTFIIQLPVV